MAFKRYGRPTYKRKRKFVRKPRSFARKVKSVINSYAEKKRQNTTWAADECDNTGRMHVMTNIAVGSTLSDRIGRQIRPQSIVYNFFVQNNAQNTSHVFTMLIFCDKQQVGDNTPLPGEVIANVGTAGAPCGLLNVNNKGRFKVLRRIQVRVEDKDSGKNLCILKGVVKLRGISTAYNGDTTVDIERNGLYALLISSAAGADDAILITGEMRMWYIDI